MIIIELPMETLQNIINEAARHAAAETLRGLHPDTDRISQTEAEREFGYAWMKRHIADGSAKFTRGSGSKNAKKAFSRNQLKQIVEMEKIKKEIIIKTKKR